MVQSVARLITLIVISTIIVTHSQSVYKYEVNIDHLEIPKRDLLFDFGTLRVKKFNRTLYTLDGHFDILQPFSDEFWAMADIFGEYGNDYFKIMDKRITKLCTFFKDDVIVVAKVINATSLAPAIARCPIPEGRIHFYNTHMPIERLALEPMLTKGKVRLRIYLGDVLMSDIWVYFELNKQSLK